MPEREEFSFTVDSWIYSYLHNGNDRLKIPTHLGYQQTKPFEVSMGFYAFNKSYWSVSRDVLMQSCDLEREEPEQPVASDFQIRRRERDGEKYLEIHLESDSGKADLDMSLEDVGDFIDKTLEFVPKGKESEYVVFDIENIDPQRTDE